MNALRPHLLSAVLVATVSLQAADWPRWLGPNGDNRAPAAGKLPGDVSKWTVAWKADVGRGYAAIAVAGTRAYTLGHDGQGKETVVCLDAGSGAVVWRHSYPAELLPKMHGGGPNATPTIHGDRVLTVSKDGQVFCLGADKGNVVWQAKLTDLGLPLPQWGFGSSPVVDGSRVLLAAGRVVALDLATGKSLWQSAEQHPGYATAVPFRRGDRAFVAALDGKGLSVLTAEEGKEVVRRPFKAMFDVTASTPYVLEDGRKLFVSGNTSAELLEFDGTALNPVWASTEVKTALNNAVLADGAIYAVDGRQGTAARFVSVRLADGKANWAQAGFGYGTVIGVGPELLALTEGGELVAVKASPESYQELGRQQVLGKTCWTTPVFAGDRIFVRNDRGEAVCLKAP